MSHDQMEGYNPNFSKMAGEFNTLRSRIAELEAANKRMIDIAGEALGTAPEQRCADTVEVLANHARRLGKEIVKRNDEIAECKAKLAALVGHMEYYRMILDATPGIWAAGLSENMREAIAAAKVK